MMLLLRQIGWELYRMFARKRTYIGFGLFLIVEVLFFVLWTREGTKEGLARFMERIAGGFDEYFSALTLGFLIVVFTMLLLGTIFISLVTGDILAKEAEDGNLRMILIRPISRFRLLFVKFISCQIYALALFWFVGIVAFVLGLSERGWGGGMFVWAPELPRVSLFDWNEGMVRYWLAITAFSFVYLPIIGIAFMFSCFNIKPAAATIITVAIVIADKILSSIPLPFFEPYRVWFLNPKLNSWLYLFHQEIPWARFLENCTWLIGIGMTGFVIGWIAFERRDVKS